MSDNKNWVTRKPSHAIFSMFGLLAVVLLPLGVMSFSSTYSEVSRGLKANGTVVEIVTRQPTLSGRTSRTESYAPKVRFVTQSGKEVMFVSRNATSPPTHSVGDEVEVIYQPDDPRQAMIDSFVHIWLLSTLLLSFGSVCALVAALALYWILNRRSIARDLQQRAMTAESTGNTSDAERLLKMIDKRSNTER